MLGECEKKNCLNLGGHLGNNEQGIECFPIWPRYHTQYGLGRRENCYWQGNNAVAKTASRVAPIRMEGNKAIRKRNE